MINHARTLLLNELPAPGTPGEEYIPRGYVVKLLPLHLKAVRDILLGAGTTREAKNYRVRQLMTLLHTSELSRHVYALDRRVTYWPTHDLTCYRDPPNGLLPLEKLPDILQPVVFEYDAKLFYSIDNPLLRECAESWLRDTQLACRLGALTLAYIYNVEMVDVVEGY